MHSMSNKDFEMNEDEFKSSNYGTFDEKMSRVDDFNLRSIS